ncbi:MAG: FIVAR domain-containing protein [Clostridia bacterium]|nr:FIVAR domain-containing protein [Clostridia bacterium]
MMRRNKSTKILSVILSVLMLFGVFTPVIAFADSSNPPTYSIDGNRNVTTTYKAATDKYGTAPWSAPALPTAQSTNPPAGWEYYSVINGNDYIYYYYPAEIYVDMSETLESAGYFTYVYAHYGAKKDKYRAFVSGWLWGEISDRVDDGGGTTVYTTDTSNDNYASWNALKTLFEPYYDEAEKNADRRYNYHQGTNNQGGTFQNDDMREDDNNVGNVILWHNNGKSAYDELIYLRGTPKQTGSIAYKTWGGSPVFMITQKEDWGWKDSIVYRKNAVYNNSGNQVSNSNSSSQKISGWNEIIITYNVYDKSELKALIDTCDTVYNSADNKNYTAYAVGNTWTTFETALNKAKTMLTTREIKADGKTSQQVIDDMVDELQDALDALAFKADATGIQSDIDAAKAIKTNAGADYENIYSASARAALQSALDDAERAVANVTTYYPAVDHATNSGISAYSDQDALKTNYEDPLEAAIAAMDPDGLNPPSYTAYETWKTAHATLPEGNCYTAASLAAYNEKLAAMETLKADTALTWRDDQSDVDAAMTAIGNAYDALVADHDYSDYVNNGDGTHSIVCSRDHSHVGTASVTHAYTTRVSTNQPYACQPGTAVDECVCGAQTEVTVAATAEHTYNETKVAIDTEATCTTPGQKTYTCVVCEQETKQESYTDPDAHKYTGAWENTGDAEYHYDYCVNDRTHAAQKAAHDFSGDPVIVDATYDAPGSKTWTCPDCGYQKIESIPQKTHTYGEWTDDENGTTHSRTVDGSGKETANHDFSGDPVVVEATYDAPGSKTWSCSVCSATKVETIAQKQYTYGDPVDNGDGTHRRTANENPAVVIDEAHTFTTTSTTPATCNANSISHQACACGAVRDITNPGTATGKHEYREYARDDADCGNAGTKYLRCAECGNETTETIPATGNHSWKIVNESPATCQQTGSRDWECRVCDATKSEVIGKIDHYDRSPKDGKCDMCGNDMPDESDTDSEVVGGYPTDKDGKVCAYCGQVHKDDMWGRLLHVIHSILAFFLQVFRMNR